jgi:hypothetical protein
MHSRKKWNLKEPNPALLNLRKRNNERSWIGKASFEEISKGCLMSLVDLFFGCWHKNYSFPITARGLRRSPAAAVTGTYVVCLDCGKEFPYSWQEMKVVSASPRESKVATIPEPVRSLAKTA